MDVYYRQRLKKQNKNILGVSLCDKSGVYLYTIIL